MCKAPLLIDTKMRNYDFHKNLILRTPILPAKTTFTEAELVSLFNSAIGRESLFLASPNFLKEYDRFVQGEIRDEKKRNKILQSLMKYAIRMHTRCTPFGLFAGCSIVNWGDESRVVMIAKERVRKTRLDMNFLCALVAKISNDDIVKNQLVYYPNTSLYTAGENYRYIEYTFKSGRREYQISAVAISSYLDDLLQAAVNGGTIASLADLLVADDISVTEATHFIETVIENQILVPQLEPTVYGKSQLTSLIESLENKIPNEGIQSWVKPLKRIDELLKELDHSFDQNGELYQEIESIIKDFDIEYDSKHLFQTDLFSANKSNVLDKHSQAKLEKGLRALNRLTSSMQQTELNNFKQKFLARYEDAEVPLAIVLDNEAGLGYAGNDNLSGTKSPLLNGLMLGQRASVAPTVNFGAKERYLLAKLQLADKRGEKTVNIELDELNWTAENWDDLPDSMSAMFNKLGGGKIMLNYAGGASAINLIGRFASGNEAINKIAKTVAEHEEQLYPHQVLAEIVHLPESRTGNILMRPKFRAYEIPFLAGIEERGESQIGMNDLYVSVKNDRIILRSKRLNKEVLPRLGNAHNYAARSLPIYHFLCDLQFQGKQRPSLGFSWGVLKHSFDFLPRIEIDDVILSPAQWHLKEEALSAFKAVDPYAHSAVDEWLKAHELPTKLVYSEGDNKLVIDFSSPFSILLLKDLLAKQKEVWLSEALLEEDGGVCDQKGNGFANQFVATLLKRQLEQNTLQSIHNNSIAEQEVQRSFSIGSEWLYYKIYTGLKTADAVLEDIVHPVARRLEEEKRIDKWFFIRYTDPDPHLRVRFHFSNRADVGKAIEYIENALEASALRGHIKQLQTDTYQREIERYGAETMVLSENLFYEDSKAITGLIRLVEGTEGEEIRWLFGLALIDGLLDDFGYSIVAKLSLIERLKKGFSDEFKAGKQFNKHLDKKYRADKTKINAFLHYDLSYFPEYDVIFQLIKLRSKANQSIVRGINKKIGEEVNHRKNELLASYLHMTVNRLFRNQQRAVELVLYTYMWKYYKAELAIEKRKTALLESA